MKLLNQLFTELLARGMLSRQEAIDLIASGQVSGNLLPDLFDEPRSVIVPASDEESIWTLDVQEELEYPRRPKARQMRKPGRDRRRARKGLARGHQRA